MRPLSAQQKGCVVSGPAPLSTCSIDRVAGKFASVKRPAIGYVPQSMVISPVLRGLL